MAEKKREHTNSEINLWSATSIGLGAMIGAGIFALVGIGVEIAGTHTYLAFIFAGILALLTAYNMSKLAVAFPNKGGKVAYINHAFQSKVLAGGLGVLTSLGYIIVTSLYARAFSEYGLALFGMEKNEMLVHILSSGVVVIFVVINFIGAKAVGNVGLITAAIQTIILLFFGFAGMMQMDTSNFEPASSMDMSSIVLVTGIIFMSYEGFGLVTNTAEDIKEPRKNLPRALYLSVIVVMFVYVIVNLAVIGNLSVPEIIDSKQYVLAEAAKPIFGSRGFELMGIAALFSTASAINSTIYGPVYMAQETAEANQLPSIFQKPLWGDDSGWALLILGSVILIVTNTLNLQTIAETGSLVFLVVYAAVNIANFRMREFTESNVIIIILGVISTIFAFFALAYFLLSQDGLSFYVFLGLTVFSFVYEWLYQVYRGKYESKQGKSESSD